MSSIARHPAVNDRAAEPCVPDQLRLAGFVLDLAAGELRTADHQLAGLRKQALDVLLVLGARAGRVVTKDELMRSVWRDVVVGEGSLAQAISDARHVLRDHDHRLVRNVARRGYMLVPDPALDAAAGANATQSLATTAGADAPAVNSTSASTPTPLSRRRLSTAIAALCLMVAALWGTSALLKSGSQRGPSATARPSLAAEGASG